MGYFGVRRKTLRKRGRLRRATLGTFGYSFNMILSASINLFDGEELLDAKLRALRSEIDHISIVYQTRSYVGNPCSPLLLEILDHL